MCDGAKAGDVLLAAQNRKLAQQLVDVQKQVVTIRRCLSKYRLMLSPDIELGFQEFCRRLQDSALENVKCRQREIKRSFFGELALFKQIFPNFESHLGKSLPNA